MTIDAAEQKRTAAALLAWYRAMGVDAAVDDAPTDWLARGDVAPGAGTAREPPAGSVSRQGKDHVAPARSDETPTRARQPSSASAPPPARQAPTTAPGGAEMAARRAAQGIRTLAELETAIRNFEGCGLRATAKNCEPSA